MMDIKIFLKHNNNNKHFNNNNNYIGCLVLTTHQQNVPKHNFVAQYACENSIS